MKERDYRRLQKRLESMEDVERLAKEKSYDREFLFVAYTQSVVRKATKDYYRIKRNVKRHLSKWKQGKSFLEIAEAHDFPPILMAQMVLLHSGVGRKTFWKWVREEEKISDKRLRRELKEAVDADPIYSPAGNRAQKIRGLRGERKLSVWLESKGCQWKNEDDLRGDTPKTPDCVLDDPITIKGQKINWIESKANFGDKKEIRRNMKKQLRPYKELFGPGAVVYWLGYVDDHGFDDEGIIIVDGKELTGSEGLHPITEEMVKEEL